MPTDFFYALTLPFNFLRLKDFPFFLPYLPTSGTGSWLHWLPTPFFREPAQSPKRQFSYKREKYTDEIFHFRKRPIHPGTGKQRITLTERKISQRRNSITQRRHFINQRRKSFRQLRKDYFTTNCLHDKTDFLYSILRIQSKNIISYGLPSPILRRIFLTNLFSMQNGISHSQTSASSASSEAPMHQNKKDPEQKNVRSLLSSIYRLAI